MIFFYNWNASHGHLQYLGGQLEGCGPQVGNHYINIAKARKKSNALDADAIILTQVAKVTNT